MKQMYDEINFRIKFTWFSNALQANDFLCTYFWRLFSVKQDDAFFRLCLGVCFFFRQKMFMCFMWQSNSVTRLWEDFIYNNRICLCFFYSSNFEHNEFESPTNSPYLYEYLSFFLSLSLFHLHSVSLDKNHNNNKNNNKHVCFFLSLAFIK